MSVVLPLPVRPSSPSTRPGASWKERSCSTGVAVVVAERDARERDGERARGQRPPSHRGARSGSAELVHARDAGAGLLQVLQPGPSARERREEQSSV